MRERAEEYLKAALNDPAATFREGQYEAIDMLVGGKKRVLVVQRTGWGKSIVYFIATRLLRNEGAGPSLLISPLLSLMRNQIEMAERLGIAARTINSSNKEEWENVRSEMMSDRVDVLLVSPERLANTEFVDRCLLPVSDRIGLFIVDEAHCISDWGHDFRPDYRRIVRILNLLPENIPVIATTATANDRVVRDIVEQLGHNLSVMRGPLARESLRLQNIHMPDKSMRMAWLVEQLPRMPGSGIIYVLTTRDADRLALWLQQHNINAKAYHARLENKDREPLEQMLLNNEVKALVASTALGMGFDKPDLGFVVHFQRPGSVVSYYQQVGRAGRGLDSAYGILFCGAEDDEIIDYFIRTAFPPIVHVEAVLSALKSAPDGLTTAELERKVNLRRTRLEKVLKFLSVETPSPIRRLGSRWYQNPIKYEIDLDKIGKICEIRRQEQRRMQEYMASRECLMAFLAAELSDPDPRKCGRCAVCRGEPLLPVACGERYLREALEFLKRWEIQIEPRKLWAADSLPAYGFSGRIKPELLAEYGRALCSWGDPLMGDLIKEGKFVTGRFDDRLVEASAKLILERWRPKPSPVWLTCVPSLTRPRLVPDFARRLAAALNVRFEPCIIKILLTSPQKEMENSFHQAHNLDGAFAAGKWEGIDAPVLLVDDMVDSRWTMTVLAALLRQAGSGPVFPFALADTSSAQL